ncbi:hypothetical protein Tco_0914298 [Tanacetum coccineum]
MIVVNNRRDLVYPPPLAPKPKKGKSQIVTPPLPKSQGLEASGALSKKRKKFKSKKPPIETKVTTPEPKEGSEQSHSVSSGTVPDPQDLERHIQLASTRLPSTLNEGTRKLKPLLESSITYPKDSRGNDQPLDRDLTFMTSNEGTAKTTPHPKGSHVRAILLSKDEAQESKEDIVGAGEEIDDNPQSTEASNTDSLNDKILKKYDDTRPLTERQLWEKHEEAAIHYVNLKASIDDYYNENIAHRDQTDQLVEAFMSTLEKSSTTITDLYKGINVIIQLLKGISNAVKDDPAANLKINEATKTFTTISSNITEVLSLVKGFDFSALLSTVKDLQAHALKQEEASASWTKSFTNMAWNLRSRMSAVEHSQTAVTCEVSSLRQDTSKIKSMMAEIYQAFKGQPSSAPSSSVTPKFALTNTSSNVEGENDTHTATEEPPSHTKGETDANIQEKPKEPKQSTDANIFIGSSTHPPSITQAQPIIIIHPEPSVPQREGKGIETDDQTEDQRKLVKASSIVHPNPDEPVIRVVREEAKKLGIHPKEVITAKAGELFKKAQDDEHEVLKRLHTEKIHPKTKPVVITVYRGTDRNFDVHKPFLFGLFGVSELDKLKEIIVKKKNTVVKDLMNSLSQRYERLRQIPRELRIQSDRPAPKQVLSQTSKRKQKHIELEPEIRILGLE